MRLLTPIVEKKLRANQTSFGIYLRKNRNNGNVRFNVEGKESFKANQ